MKISTSITSSPDYPGTLYVIAAPSGAGKSSLVKALMEIDTGISVSISHTTRPRRGQEQEGREYHFCSPQEFDALVEQGIFLEWAHVHGHRYGTSRQTVEQRMREGRDVILEIDFQGATSIKQLFANAVLVFVLPPSWEELRARLMRRAEDTPEVIALRLENAKVEMAQIGQFDYVIVNEFFDQALLDLKAIVQVQRLRLPAQRRARAKTFLSLNIA